MMQRPPTGQDREAANPVLFLAGSVCVFIGVMIVLMLAIFSVSITFWLAGSITMTAGLLLRALSAPRLGRPDLRYICAHSISGTLSFLNLVVLVKMIVDWVAGDGSTFNFEAMFWALGLAAVQVALSKVEDRYQQEKPSTD